ncbi:hypothetical protein [Leuconostoc pseudomesenteroides]|uniref:hypothetical protein n=1 Tax=Leuconostoc pseudomesenteroides TaxID=33968 RepID=UPI0039EC43B2
MNITVNGAHFDFVDDNLIFQYYDVIVGIGSVPISTIGGNVQVTPEQGVSANSTKQEVIDATKAFVFKTSSEEPSVYPGL